jgi:hypothetical protein
MQASNRPTPQEVDLLFRNAHLRDELEAYADDSLTCIDWSRQPIEAENEYLECMLAWEQAPVLPIHQWLGANFRTPHPDSLNDADLSTCLWDVIHRLYQQRVIIEHADHLSDRELYWIIYREILPACVKHLRRTGAAFLRWRCVDAALHPELWLSYYADPVQRKRWSYEHGEAPPPPKNPPYPRMMPQAG